MAETKQKVHVNKEAKPNFRDGSARAKYWEVIAAHDGKTVDTLVKNLTDSPPSTPNRGKLKGKPEPVQGWISFFTRNGYIEIK